MQDRDIVLMQGVLKVPGEARKCAIPSALQISRKDISTARATKETALVMLSTDSEKVQN